MKRSLILFALIFAIHLHTFSQNQFLSKTRELYLTSHSLTGNNLGVQYKSSTDDKLFYRFGLFNLIVSKTDNVSSNIGNYPERWIESSVLLQTGIEKRLSIAEKSNIYYGIDFIGHTSFTRHRLDSPIMPEEEKNIDTFIIKAGIGIPLGCIVNLKNNFFIAVEIEPEIFYEKRTATKNEYKNEWTFANFNLDTETIKISLIYKWNKKNNH